jgi:glycosyltransferase involved in cell wall biosynthesis
VKPKLLYIYPSSKAFILSDKAILEQEYTVITQELPWFNKYQLIFNFLRQFFFLVFKIKTVDKVVVAFGGYWSFLPAYFARKYNKECYIILHGTDCVSFPKLNYGMLRKVLPKYFIKKSYQWATKLLPVSESLVYTENRFYHKKKVSKQGFMHYFPNLETPYTVVYNGLDEKKWFPLIDITRKENQCLAAFTAQQWKLKGGDLLMQLAKHYPKTVFKIAGISQEFIATKKLSNNVFGLGFQSPKQMQELYSESQFFLQLSISEGFGLALAEAMLCGATPIGADVNIIPKIIGNSGYILTENDTNPLVILLSKAKQDLANSSKQHESRKHIIAHFLLEKRKKRLLAVLA